MAKLILSLEGSVIREIPLDKDRITIGRKAQNDIPIENLAVSGEHACIVTILCDNGAKYQSRLFNRKWLAEKGLLDAAGFDQNVAPMPISLPPSAVGGLGQRLSA